MQRGEDVRGAGAKARRRVIPLSITIVLALLPNAPVKAQGQQLESFFDNAQRFLDRQRRNIEREIDKLSEQGTPRPPENIGTPPLPVPNPRRPAAAPAPIPKQTPAQIPYPKRDQTITVKPPEAPDTGTAAPQKVTGPPSTETATAQSVPDPPRNPIRTQEPGQAQEGEQKETPPHPREVEVEDWTKDQIAAAKAECAGIMAELEAKYAPLPPIREGRCGAPYPIKLSSLGKDPAVAITPPATLTCSMAASLSRWLEETVQPAAIEQFEARITEVQNVASYVCRTRYDNPETRISEHGLANALDIASFKSDDGQRVTLSQHWVLAAPTEAEPAGEDAPNKAKVNKSDTSESARPSGVVTTEKTAPAAPPEPDPKDIFLRAVHDGACAVFGTVLGPDANEAHRDHFHLDMKERRHSAYCE